MKKKVFTTITALVLAVCTMLGSIFSVTAYASEKALYPNFPFVGTVPYATTYHVYQPDEIIHDFEFKNNATIGYFTLANDLRIHRFKLKAPFCLGLTDQGVGKVKLTVKITSNMGFEETLTATTNDANIAYHDVMLESPWYTAHPNEVFTIWVDASTAPGYTPNGNFRCIYFSDFQLYCD